MCTSASTVIGSPPRLRGTQWLLRDVECCPRLTPALAGNTMAIARRRMLSTAYPRACGEHPCSISLFVKELLVPDQATNKSRSKSRPWASGFWFSHLRRLAEHLNEKLLGLTPAPAGNTVTRLGFCGLFSGLPPRLRGTLAVAQESCSYVRFTPAPAGNTSGRSGQIG